MTSCCIMAKNYDIILHHYASYDVVLHHIGVPTTGIILWRRVFIDNIKLKRNWRLGNCVTSTFTSHTHRVLCVKVKEKEGICASGGSDRTIRIWSLRDGKLLNTIYSPDTVCVTKWISIIHPFILIIHPFNHSFIHFLFLFVNSIEKHLVLVFLWH